MFEVVIHCTPRILLRRVLLIHRGYAIDNFADCNADDVSDENIPTVIEVSVGIKLSPPDEAHVHPKTDQKMCQRKSTYCGFSEKIDDYSVYRVVRLIPAQPYSQSPSQVKEKKDW